MTSEEGESGKYWQGSLGGVADGRREVAQKLFFADLRPLAPALRTNQDDAGHALAFYALHVPPRVDGFFRRGELPVAMPAAAFARRADRVECGIDVKVRRLRCFDQAQAHLLLRSFAPQGRDIVAGGNAPGKRRQRSPTLKGSHETSRPQVALVILNPVFVQQRDELLLEGQLLVPFLLAGNVVLQGFHL